MIEQIIKQLPLELHEIKAFRVANEEKITINVETGKYEIGPKDAQPLYTLDDLRSMKLPGEAKYIQFVPGGTPYTILDFDTDKSRSDDTRKDLTTKVVDLLHDFDGLIEYSASGLGIHAYVKDKRLSDLTDRFKVKLMDGVYVEVFHGESPIILTGNYVKDNGIDEVHFNFDTCPKKVLKAISDGDIASTEEKASTPQLDPKDEPLFSDIEMVLKKVKEKPDAQNNINNGYPGGADCSDVDNAVAVMFLDASDNDPSLATAALEVWMTEHRAKSHCPKTAKEIKNKVERAIKYHYKPKPTAPTSKIIADIKREFAGLKVKPDATTMFDMLSKVHGLYIKPKTFKKIEGSDLFYENATHMVVAPAKEGKTHFIIEELSKITEKTVIILDGDGNGADMLDRKGKNTIWLQPINSDEYLNMVLSLIENGLNCSDVVFLVDALQNFTEGKSIDNNKDAPEIITRIKKLTSSGGTVVILHHVTPNADGSVKVKGNQEGLFGSVDISYLFSRGPLVTALRSRISGINNGAVVMSPSGLSSTEKEDDGLD